jgi:hypothetical protein
VGDVVQLPTSQPRAWARARVELTYQGQEHGYVALLQYADGKNAVLWNGLDYAEALAVATEKARLIGVRCVDFTNPLDPDGEGAAA